MWGVAPAVSSARPPRPAVSSARPPGPAVSSARPPRPAVSSARPPGPAVSSARPPGPAVSSARPLGKKSLRLICQATSSCATHYRIVPHIIIIGVLRPGSGHWEKKSLRLICQATSSCATHYRIVPHIIIIGVLLPGSVFLWEIKIKRQVHEHDVEYMAPLLFSPLLVFLFLHLPLLFFSSRVSSIASSLLVFLFLHLTLLFFSSCVSSIASPLLVSSFASSLLLFTCFFNCLSSSRVFKLVSLHLLVACHNISVACDLCVGGEAMSDGNDQLQG